MQTVWDPLAWSRALLRSHPETSGHCAQSRVRTGAAGPGPAPARSPAQTACQGRARPRDPPCPRMGVPEAHPARLVTSPAPGQWQALPCPLNYHRIPGRQGWGKTASGRTSQEPRALPRAELPGGGLSHPAECRGAGREPPPQTSRPEAAAGDYLGHGHAGWAVGALGRLGTYLDGRRGENLQKGKRIH